MSTSPATASTATSFPPLSGWTHSYLLRENRLHYLQSEPVYGCLESFWVWSYFHETICIGWSAVWTWKESSWGCFQSSFWWMLECVLSCGGVPSFAPPEITVPASTPTSTCALARGSYAGRSRSYGIASSPRASWGLYRGPSSRGWIYPTRSISICVLYPSAAHRWAIASSFASPPSRAIGVKSSCLENRSLIQGSFPSVLGWLIIAWLTPIRISYWE